MSLDTWKNIKQKIFDERGGRCECGCGKVAHDLHHVFIHNIKRKGSTKYPQLNDERNLVFVNHDEHILRKFDNQQWREYFWQVQIDRFGYDSMLEWMNSLPEKIKFRIDWIRNGQK